MASPNAVHFREVVKQLRDFLAREQFGNSVELVRIVTDRAGRTATSPQFNLQGDQNILLHPRGFGTDRNVVRAAGRFDTEVRRLIDIVLRSRRESDPIMSEEDMFFRQSEFEDQVFNLVQMWWGDPAAVTTEAEQLMVGEGINTRIVDGGPGIKELFSGDGTWIVSVLSMEVIHRQDLDLSASNQ